jgi:hypothetical protein
VIREPLAAAPRHRVPANTRPIAASSGEAFRGRRPPRGVRGEAAGDTSCFEKDPYILVCYGAVREQQRFPRASRRTPLPSGTLLWTLTTMLRQADFPSSSSSTKVTREVCVICLRVADTRAIARYQAPQASSSKRMSPVLPLSNVAFLDRDRIIPRDARGVNVKHFR